MKKFPICHGGRQAKARWSADYFCTPAFVVGEFVVVPACSRCAYADSTSQAQSASTKETTDENLDCCFPQGMEDIDQGVSHQSIPSSQKELVRNLTLPPERGRSLVRSTSVDSVRA